MIKKFKELYIKNGGEYQTLHRKSTLLQDVVNTPYNLSFSSQ